MPLLNLRTRSKPPYWCCHQSLTTRKPDCQAPLKESDANLCQRHETEKREAEKRFFEAPIVPTKAVDEVEVKPIWPV